MFVRFTDESSPPRLIERTLVVDPFATTIHALASCLERLPASRSLLVIALFAACLFCALLLALVRVLAGCLFACASHLLPLVL